MKTKTIIFMNNSKSDYVKPMEFSFPGCPIQFLETPLTPPEIEKLVKKVNEEYDQIIFFDYCYNYYLMLPIISKKVKVKWILDTSIAALANVDIYNPFFQVIEYKERKLVDTIATLDYSMYLTFKNKYDFMYLTLDIDMKKNKNGFTLIELLAVIVILGVIMVIATTNVIKSINNPILSK